MSNGDDKWFIFIERGTDPTVSGIDAPLNAICTYEGEIYRKYGDGPNDWERITGASGGGGSFLAGAGTRTTSGAAATESFRLWPVSNGSAANPDGALLPPGTLSDFRLVVDAADGEIQNLILRITGVDGAPVDIAVAASLDQDDLTFEDLVTEAVISATAAAAITFVYDGLDGDPVNVEATLSFVFTPDA